MKNINTYTDLAAYTADTNRATTNTVSFVKDGTGNLYKGTNVVVDKQFADVGDSWVYDKNDGKYKVVKLDTLNLATLPSNYVIGATVYFRESGIAQVLANVELGNFQWGAPYKVKLSGFDLATGGNFTVTVNTTTTASIVYTTSDTLVTIATKIMAALETAGFTAATGWSVTAYASYIVVQQNFYAPNITVFTITDADSKVVRVILTGNYQTALSGVLTPNSSIFRKDGSSSYYAGGNLGQFYNRYSTSGSEDINQTVGTTSIIKESYFTIERNPLLVAYYGTYLKYLDDKMIKSPYSKGIITDLDAKSNTNKLAAIMYPDHDGSQQPDFPAAYAANQYGIDTPGHVTGFEKGNWYMQNVDLAYKLMKNITYGLTGITTANMDAFNRGRYAAGLSPISVSVYIWLCSEYSSYRAWSYSGIYGIVTNNYKIYSLSVRPAQAFPL